MKKKISAMHKAGFLKRILTLLIAPGWLTDYLAPLAAKAANTLLPIGYVALIVEMFRAQRIYLQTEEQ